MTNPRFTLLVPVKDGRDAKTRLADLGPQGRADLMAAFARDAITAATATPVVEVRLVGDPTALRELAAELHVDVIADEGAGDLNEALRRAADRVRRPDRGVAVLLADLPCLRTADLELALSRPGRGYVADASGTGTTLLFAAPGTDLDPHFGRGSAQAHAASGAAPVTDALTSLRLDVDTTADLDRAVRVGVGPSTAAAVAGLARPPA